MSSKNIKSGGCWVFNMDQLARALHKLEPDKREAILDFLASEAAKSCGLIVPSDCSLDDLRGGVLQRIFKLSQGVEL